MSQLEHIEAIEKQLWGAADNLRANSNFASNEYFMPVMGLIFLRHAYSRFLEAKTTIVVPTRGGKARSLTKEDFSQHGAILLREKAQFDFLVELPDSEDRATAIIQAMESIESDYDNLQGLLPKGEYQELDNEVLGQLLRTLNPDELKQVSGDVFGRIYEYFLTQFADQKAHDGGEFFTPISLVSFMANVLDPKAGTVLDPACGSGGMFVQSARIVERQGLNPTEKLTFKGLEKNATTLRLAKMNLAVHGLDGDIERAITYYEDPHQLVGQADYVMANPPFNVDEIDAEKVENDPRLPFGLPGVNKKEKVSNGNYIWISYFYSYLNQRGQAGFVMSSQASSAGKQEAAVRQRLIETGDVEMMVAIRNNFFYTRTVPCELWFLNRNKPEAYQDKVLMIDARNTYRQVTRKIYDFSPEQQQNLLAIVWLYRGQTDKYLQLVADYCHQVLAKSRECFQTTLEDDEVIHPLADYMNLVQELVRVDQLSFEDAIEIEQAELKQDLDTSLVQLKKSIEIFSQCLDNQQASFPLNARDLNEAVERLKSLADISRDVIKQVERAHKQASTLIDSHRTNKASKNSAKDISNLTKKIDVSRENTTAQLEQVSYFYQQAVWLTERFPDAELHDVEGLVKLVGLEEIEANDWSLTPGRYVGIAPEEVDESFDFEETMLEIHVELDSLDTEAKELAETIKQNFERLVR